MKKMIFKNITIFFRDTIFFSSPIDDLRRDPTKDSIGCKSFVYYGEKKII